MSAITKTAARVAPVYADRSMIRPMIAGAAVTPGDPLYIDGTLGTVKLADGNGTGTKQFCGFALATKAAGEAVDVLVDGWLDGYDVSGLAFGALVYVSDTAGGLDTTTGTVAVVVGRVEPLSDRDPVTGKPSKVLRVRTNVTADWA
jgi:hypothetical protein